MHRIDVKDLSILLVEPSVTQLKVMLKRLDHEGIDKVEGVESGLVALQSLEKFVPDLVISSMYLPDMTATDLVGKMRGSSRLQHVPFMLVSSETQFRALDPIRQAGVIAILPKPFSQEDLCRALRATINLIDAQELDLENYDAYELRVLVVDDSALARKYIERVLKSLGIEQITTANDGQQAVAIFQEGDYDLIVTDYNMPHMDGYQLVEYIRNQLGNTYIPILMVTSEQNMAKLSNVEQAGVSAICDKPFDPDNVKEILYRVFSA